MKREERYLTRINGGYGKVVEPRVVVRECPAKWEKLRIDLEELAALRREGWQTKQLGAHFGVSLSAVKMAYAKLRK